MNQLEKNIVEAITAARRVDVVAMSLANLKQITPTKGLVGVISVAEYHSTFEDVARKVAKQLRFRIIEGGEE